MKHKEYYNGKVRCINNSGLDNFWTLGKIYEIKDGKVLCENGADYLPYKVESFQEFVFWSLGQWVEVKGEVAYEVL